MERRSCSPEGDSFFAHSHQRDWAAKSPSASVDGTFAKGPRSTVQSQGSRMGALYNGGGIGDLTQPILVSPPRVKISTADRWPSDTGHRTALQHEPFPSMVKASISTQGTFLVNKSRGNFFSNITATPGPKYNQKAGMWEEMNTSKSTSFYKNTSNFRSKAARFVSLMDPEDAPGPIYLPKSDFGTKGVSLPTADRFPYRRELRMRKVPGPGAYSLDAFKVPPSQKKGTESVQCSFGQRIEVDYTSDSPGPAHYVTHAPPKGPQHSFSPAPFDNNNVGSRGGGGGGGGKNKNPVSSVIRTPSPGTLRMSYVIPPKHESDTASFSMSVMPRFQKEKVDGRDYNVLKYKPKNKPTCPTFARETHDKTFVRMMPCRDSPGPSLHSSDKLPRHSNFNCPLPGTPNRWR